MTFADMSCLANKLASCETKTSAISLTILTDRSSVNDPLGERFMLSNNLREKITLAKRQFLITAGAATVAIALGACSGGSETSSTPATKPAAPTPTASAPTPSTPTLELEKEQLRFGFIKLTDMAPLAIAYEKGFFEDEGLFVTLEAQANWKVLLDGVIEGKLDGAPA